MQIKHTTNFFIRKQGKAHLHSTLQNQLKKIQSP